jgi:hypothetical protein
MTLKVGNIIGDCLKYFFIFLICFQIVKLDAVVGFGGYGKVFKVTNIKTKEIKALKAIPIWIIHKARTQKNSRLGWK